MATSNINIPNANSASSAGQTGNPYRVNDEQDGSKSFQVNTAVAQSPYLNDQLNTINSMANKVQGQTAATSATPAQATTAQSAPTNVNQQGFNAQAQALNNAQGQANGTGPAAQAVQMQSQNAINQGLNAQLAMAGSMRGGNAGEALRQASVGQANVTGQAANQAAQNTLASEQAGQQNLGNISGAMQGEALGQAQLGQQNNQFNAGATNTANAQTQSLGNTTALANAAGQNQFTQNQDQQIQSLMNNGFSLQQAQQQANIQMAQYATGSAADQYAATQGHAISQQNADTSSANAAIQGLGTAANIASGVGSAVSDKRAKKDIEPGEPDVSNFLDSLTPHTWNYKDPDKHGEGQHLGVMAQDLQKSDMGDAMVAPDHEGTLRVDYGGAKGMAAIVASLAHLNDKIKALEGMKASK